MNNRPLTLPTAGGSVIVFNMTSNKLIVRMNPGGVSSIFIIEADRVAYRVHDYERHWVNAVCLVGKFLADNPTY